MQVWHRVCSGICVQTQRPMQSIFINYYGTPMSVATTEVYDLLFKQFKGHIVRFTYFRKDGAVRSAVGTRNLRLAEQRVGHSIPKPHGPRNVFAYYDVQVDGWRSFIAENVCSIDKVE